MEIVPLLIPVSTTAGGIFIGYLLAHLQLKSPVFEPIESVIASCPQGTRIVIRRIHVGKLKPSHPRKVPRPSVVFQVFVMKPNTGWNPQDRSTVQRVHFAWTFTQKRGEGPHAFNEGRWIVRKDGKLTQPE
jgi:hypothetical protein